MSAVLFFPSLFLLCILENSFSHLVRTHTHTQTRKKACLCTHFYTRTIIMCDHTYPDNVTHKSNISKLFPYSQQIQARLQKSDE